jgi:hypothetical protein
VSLNIGNSRSKSTVLELNIGVVSGRVGSSVGTSVGSLISCISVIETGLGISKFFN